MVIRTSFSMVMPILPYAGPYTLRSWVACNSLLSHQISPLSLSCHLSPHQSNPHTHTCTCVCVPGTGAWNTHTLTCTSSHETRQLGTRGFLFCVTWNRSARAHTHTRTHTLTSMEDQKTELGVGEAPCT